MFRLDAITTARDEKLTRLGASVRRHNPLKLHPGTTSSLRKQLRINRIAAGHRGRRVPHPDWNPTKGRWRFHSRPGAGA